MATSFLDSSAVLESSAFMSSEVRHEDGDRVEQESVALVPPPMSCFEVTGAVDGSSDSSKLKVDPFDDGNSVNATAIAVPMLTLNSPSQTHERKELAIDVESDCESSDGDNGGLTKKQRKTQLPLHPVTLYADTTATQVVTHPSPSWKELSSEVLPEAAKELLSSSFRRVYHTARLSVARSRWHRKYSDIGNKVAGFNLEAQQLELPSSLILQLPSVSSLSWIDRQLVKEWRTYLPSHEEEKKKESNKNGNEEDEEDFDFERARRLVPREMERPSWKKSDMCFTCHKPFGPTRLRHHCRMCGNSFCQSHSSSTHSLPQLGYDPDVPERVCDLCKQKLLEQALAERVAWRLARCRDLSAQNLTPYFETGLDSMEEAALRITRAAIAMAKSIPLGAQATVAVETVDVLRKYGLHGIYGIMLRQEFLAAADLLRKALGINETAWPLSVHELSAAIFYALAQHRAMRGLYPDREEDIHRLRSPIRDNNRQQTSRESTKQTNDNEWLVDQADDAYDPQQDPMHPMTDSLISTDDSSQQPQPKDCISESFFHDPVCDPVDNRLMSHLVRYAPIALNFIYATKEVDMQLLAAQQGWRLLYAHLDQCRDIDRLTDRPASAIFVHEELKIACLAVRGTSTINDVVTDIRQIPVPFPDVDPEHSDNRVINEEEEWTDVFRGQGLALCGMASAALNLFREHIDSFMVLAKDGYRLRLTGHSMGGGVATMVGALVLRHLQKHTDLHVPVAAREGADTEETDLLRVYAYGTPSCMDANLAESVDSFTTTVVLHDDVVPRLTATSCRALLKHLLHIRETWVKAHIEEDLRAVGERAKQVWAPRFRQSFALKANSISIKRYCKRHLDNGRKKLLQVTDKFPCGDDEKAVNDDEETFVHDEDLFRDHHAGKRNLSPIRSSDDVSEEKKNSFDQENSGTQLLLEFLGGADTTIEGIVIDGEEFFDAGGSLVEQEKDGIDDISTVGGYYDTAESVMGEASVITDGESWSFDSSPQKKNELLEHPDELDKATENDPSAVFLEETKLHKMFIPGKVLHIYSHRGVYKIAQVPRTFRELRRISLAGNMLSNHASKPYYEALLEVQTAREAPEQPPRWTAFDEDNTCSCCASRFTWASTSNSEAQEARDKHNCRSCGALVCDHCARSRMPVPSIGLTTPVRVCDRCYNDMSGTSATSSMSPASFSIKNVSPSKSFEKVNYSEADQRPERLRTKRSTVVDDLASRIRSSALATYS